jgi:hypothetical protein
LSHEYCLIFFELATSFGKKKLDVAYECPLDFSAWGSNDHRLFMSTSLYWGF